jgi:hypothetical protein
MVQVDMIELKGRMKDVKYHDEEEQEKFISEGESKRGLINRKIPLDEYLLYLIFAKSTNLKIRN